jgi:hypothetical protein
MFSKLIIASAVTALTAGPAAAGYVTISGVSAVVNGVPTFLYGGAGSNNNVVNPGSPGAVLAGLPDSMSGLYDSTATCPASLCNGTAVGGGGVDEWFIESDDTPADVKYNLPQGGFVEWWYNGADSSNVNRFDSGPVTVQEANENNNLAEGPRDGFWKLKGQTALVASASAAVVPFSFLDINAGPPISNGANNPPAPGVGSMMFAYVDPIFDNGVLVGWNVSTNSESNWFAVGWDDPGSTNDNHDDLMVVGRVSPVPLPAAVWLFGSALLGIAGVGYRRNRNA